MSAPQGQQARDKANRLLEYICTIVAERSPLVRDLNNPAYVHVLWLGDIPREKGCFTKAWKTEEGPGGVWCEVRHQNRPRFPEPPGLCDGWVEEATLRDKEIEAPRLLSQITRKIPPPSAEGDGQHDSDDGEVEASSVGPAAPTRPRRSLLLFDERDTAADSMDMIDVTERLEDHPDVQEAWRGYVVEKWKPWVARDNAWERVDAVYKTLYSMWQEQVRSEERYELLLGLGRLTWKSPQGQRVCRHLLVANAVLDFHAAERKFTVTPAAEGANIRPEFDMLDVGQQPLAWESEVGESLKATGDDPWETTPLETALKAIVHLLSPDGVYEPNLHRAKGSAPAKPLVEFAPALILRSRSTRSAIAAIKTAQKNIDKGGKIPAEFSRSVEVEADSSEVGTGEGGSGHSVGNNEVYFPKASNEEQNRIVHRIQAGNGVLVQGPPGTGKSHTIANLICHLLATGHRLLVTAHKPRALQVLERLLPNELRPLCINLLGSGPEERKSLEVSVKGILSKNDDWDDQAAQSGVTALEDDLRLLREERAGHARRLADLRQSETSHFTILDGAYTGTAARIAARVAEERSRYAWFTDRIDFNAVRPDFLTDGNLKKALHWVRTLTPEKRHEMRLPRPSGLVLAESFMELVKREESALKQQSDMTPEADARWAQHLETVDERRVNELLNKVVTLTTQYRELNRHSAHWMRGAVHDCLVGRFSKWRELHRTTREKLDAIADVAGDAEGTDLTLPPTLHPKAVLEDARLVDEYIRNRGGLGWSLTRPRAVREAIGNLAQVRINGREPKRDTDYHRLLVTMTVQIRLDEGWALWSGLQQPPAGPVLWRLQSLADLCKELGEVLSLEQKVAECNQLFIDCFGSASPDWSDDSTVRRLTQTCRLALTRRTLQQVGKALRSFEEALQQANARLEAHPITAKLLEAVRERDAARYASLHEQNQRDVQDLESLRRVDQFLAAVREHAPLLAESLGQSCQDADWDDRIKSFHDAWRWSQACSWLDDYLRKEDAPALADRIKQIEEEEKATVAKLAALRAWQFCFSRLRERHRQNMVAWQDAMTRYGAGTGKAAPRYLQDARQYLANCREGVPAWVMPLHRVWETIQPQSEMFDVVIVDEASQCGLESLLLPYIAKKVIIVGDDKQIAPEEIGTLPDEDIVRLMNTHLWDFAFRGAYDPRGFSLFNHGRRLYSASLVSLQEHFRCMPEIIRFSNELCYSAKRLIPLRQFTSGRLSPLEHTLVETGFCEGKDQRVVNRPEAETLVAKIVELTQDSRYDGKTMGVVTLLGISQADLIRNLVREALEPDEVEARRIVCGNPYDFQGDERDVMFLSMVVAPNRPGRALTREPDTRRFNVAASRARDQMWLFHSVTRNDLNPQCLRSRLLQHFEEQQFSEKETPFDENMEQLAHQANRSIQKPPEPFDSWFEVDVYLEVVRKGYQAVPQYEFAGWRIDLVVQGSSANVAVECHGDYWHGPDRYEKDAARQRILERCGWEFFILWESAFRYDKQRQLERLWEALTLRGIRPAHEDLPERVAGTQGATAPKKYATRDTSVRADRSRSSDDVDDSNEEEDNNIPDDEQTVGVDESVATPPETSLHSARRRLKDLSPADIQQAILEVLGNRANNSCKYDEVTTEVLRHLGIRTRGKPRDAFERRVRRNLRELAGQQKLETYDTAKNKRVRLKHKAGD